VYDVALTFGASLLLGMRHATDPDHVVAVSTIVSRERSIRRASGIGIMWGLGHTVTVALVGGVLIAFELTLPPRIGLSLEFVVALMLITLGAANLRRKSRSHGHVSHARPFAVGVVHGLAGSAAATLLLVPFVGDARAAALFLAAFGGGTIAGMVIVTTLLAIPLVFVASDLDLLPRRIRTVSGVASVALGLYLALRLGVVDGLFAR
jgi:high-affinity nickel-transport protein